LDPDSITEIEIFLEISCFELLDVLFWPSKPWIRIDNQPKMLDPDPETMKRNTEKKTLQA
jgi:hypothetical protein